MPPCEREFSAAKKSRISNRSRPACGALLEWKLSPSSSSKRKLSKSPVLPSSHLARPDWMIAFASLRGGALPQIFPGRVRLAQFEPPGGSRGFLHSHGSWRYSGGASIDV